MEPGTEEPCDGTAAASWLATPEVHQAPDGSWFVTVAAKGEEHVALQLRVVLLSGGRSIGQWLDSTGDEIVKEIAAQG